MLQAVLDIPSIPFDVMLKIIRILCEILTCSRILEETILFVLKNFFEKLTNDFYVELNFNTKHLLTPQKNLNKILINIFGILEKFLSGKTNNLENSKNIYEFSLYFLIAKLYLKSKNSKNSSNPAASGKDRIITSLVEQHFGTGFLNSIIEDSTILSFFKLIIKNSFFSENENLKNTKNNRDNKFNNRSLNISLDFFFEILKLNQEKAKVYKVWNLIIDEKTNQILSEISTKNFQQLIYSFSKFILGNFFHLEYVKQIFDYSFFVSFMKFKIKQKFKYLNDIILVVTANLEKVIEAKQDDEETLKKVSEYSLSLLKVFGNNPENFISIQTFKNFHAVNFFLIYLN